MEEGVVLVVIAGVFNVYGLSPFGGYSYSIGLEKNLEKEAHLTS